MFRLTELMGGQLALFAVVSISHSHQISQNLFYFLEPKVPSLIGLVRKDFLAKSPSPKVQLFQSKSDVSGKNLSIATKSLPPISPFG